ncbi:Uncharacterized protein QTN25_000466 [Entamoeba marina]
MDSQTLRHRNILEKNYEELQEIERIEEKDQKTSQIFRIIITGMCILLFCLKMFIGLRALIINGFGGDEFCKNDVYFKIAPVSNGCALSFIFMMIMCVIVSITAGLWFFGLNVVMFCVLWYADRMIKQVSGDIQKFLNEHRYQS